MVLITLVDPKDGSEVNIGVTNGSMQDARNFLRKMPFVVSSFMCDCGGFQHIPTGKKFELKEIPYLHPYFPEGLDHFAQAVNEVLPCSNTKNPGD